MAHLVETLTFECYEDGTKTTNWKAVKNQRWRKVTTKKVSSNEGFKSDD
jgi:hypothetical protein